MGEPSWKSTEVQLSFSTCKKALVLLRLMLVEKIYLFMQTIYSAIHMHCEKDKKFSMLKAQGRKAQKQKTYRSSKSLFLYNFLVKDSLKKKLLYLN